LARHSDEPGVGETVTQASAYVDYFAFPNIQYARVRTGYGLKFVDEAQSTKDVHLLAADLFDTKFFRVDSSLIN
jgi:hypothetical protein